jgi:hypothetical protein
MKIVKTNQQIDKITKKNLEKPARLTKYDSTIDERERGSDARKPMPRFSEYR